MPPRWATSSGTPPLIRSELATPERCRAYARLAAEVARDGAVSGQRSARGDVAALLRPKPLVGTRCRCAVTGLGAGLRLRFLARDWQRRAAYHPTSEPAPTISARLTAYRQPPPRRDSP